MSARRIHNSSSSLSDRRKAKKSLSEIINEQFDQTRYANGADDDDFDFDFAGRADEYDDAPPSANDLDENENENHTAKKKPATTKRERQVGERQKRERQESERQAGERQKRLRRRGPVDAALSAGAYAARPVDALMDEIFGALDADENEYENNEEEEEEDNENDEGNESGDDGEKRAGRVRPRETESAFIARLEKRLAQRRERFGVRRAGGKAEDEIIAQLEELRAAQLHVLPGGGSAGETAKENDEGEDDDEKGKKEENAVAKERERAQAAVRHYVMLYAQLLRVRIKLQPAITRAVALPQYYAMSDFVAHAGDAAAAAQRDAKKALAELLGTFHALSPPPPNSAARDLSDFRALQSCHRRIMQKANVCVEHWGARLAQPKSAALQSVAQPLLDQIRAILSGSGRLRAKAQRNRAHARILAHPEHFRAETSAAGKAARALRVADGDADEEVFDDSEFLREVVKRGGVARLEQQLRDAQREMQANREPEKRGFHKMTKGKAINYEPRPKLVGFTVPVPYTLSGQHEAMMASLFQ